MISLDVIAALPSSKFSDPSKVPFRVGDWLCSGIWAARGEVLISLAKSEKDSDRNRDVLREHEAKMPGTPVAEELALRMPFVPGVEAVTKKCRECGGSGEHQCNCDQCDAGCDACEGEGEVVVKEGLDEDPGQRVYRSADVTTVIDERLGALLDGLVVVRLGDTTTDPLGGVDETGRLVALVMPLRTEVRTPAVQP